MSGTTDYIPVHYTGKSLRPVSRKGTGREATPKKKSKKRLALELIGKGVKIGIKGGILGAKASVKVAKFAYKESKKGKKRKKKSKSFWDL